MDTSRNTHNGDSFARFGADMSSSGASSYGGTAGAQGAQVRLLEEEPSCACPPDMSVGHKPALIRQLRFASVVRTV